MGTNFVSLLPFLKALQRQDMPSPQDEDESNPPADQFDGSSTPAGEVSAPSQSNPASTAQQVQPQDSKGDLLMQLLQSGLQSSNQNQVPTTLDPPMRPENPPPDGSLVQDMGYMQHVPSRIPQAGPDLKPPNLRLNDKQQQQATLAGLMQGMGGQHAPSLSPGQLQSGDFYSQVSPDWITFNEGGSVLNGYVPRARKGTDQSGVTIAAGYDLGQHTVANLRNLNLPDDLIQRLTPYVGLKGQDARDALKKQPLTVGRGEANKIDQGAFDSYFNAVGDAYDNAAGAGAFAKLPWQAQTAVADLWYNMGDLRGKKLNDGMIVGGAPNFWRQVTTGDWQGAYRNLGNFTQADSRLADRARSNSYLVKDALDHGTLPSQ